MIALIASGVAIAALAAAAHAANRPGRPAATPDRHRHRRTNGDTR